MLFKLLVGVRVGKRAPGGGDVAETPGKEVRSSNRPRPCAGAWIFNFYSKSRSRNKSGKEYEKRPAPMEPALSRIFLMELRVLQVFQYLGNVHKQSIRNSLTQVRVSSKKLTILGLVVCQTAQKSGKVKAVKVHHLGPRHHKVLHEPLLRVIASVNFSECPEL